MAVNAARVADDGKANFELPEGPSFKCDGCTKAISAALRKVDAQLGIEQYSPAKKQIQSRDDDCFLFRIEDFSLDENGDAWVHGAWFYSAAQLPTETQAELPEDFDRSSELVESVNRVMESLLEVKSVTRVTLVTSARGFKGKYRAGRVYVDDMTTGGRAWALKSSKSRDDPPLINNNNNERQLRRRQR